ncbi:hypothetical protein [Thiomicrorhabdus sp. 6S3-12]|uniref:hypothetical protein n=1 Tax=Thiomicrorhabdus sp. 6S3-12 TaxID=2819681 RepID=UPI001AAD0B80|nr:hypothetical protein [Thiomicrorhabdus sp. 6S3-12]MBO1924443.1 hypothetical protein [Thiomicrorhabdus sp. 6S3-12]
MYLILTTLLLSFQVAAAELVPASNFLEDGKKAAQLNQPIAILLVHKGVRSGIMLKEEALLPNLLSGVFDDKVMFREIEVNVDGTVIDFYGEPMQRKEFQTLFNITSLPAMVFVDSEGDQLTSPLFSGAYEFYGFYLKRKLNESMQALGNPIRFE